MYHSPEADSATLSLLRDCWDKAAQKKQAKAGDNPMLEDLHDHISRIVLPKLALLLDDRRECDCFEMVSTIKHMIIDHMFYENAVNQDQWQEKVDGHVKMILMVMHTTREKLINDEEWSKEPVAPMMFG